MQCQASNDQTKVFDRDTITADVPTIGNLESLVRVTAHNNSRPAERFESSGYLSPNSCNQATRLWTKHFPISKDSPIQCPITRIKKGQLPTLLSKSSEVNFQNNHRQATLPANGISDDCELHVSNASRSCDSFSPTSVGTPSIAASETFSGITGFATKNSSTSNVTSITTHNTAELTQLQGLWVGSSPTDVELLEVWKDLIEPLLHKALLAHIENTGNFEFLLVGKSPHHLKPTILATCTEKKDKKSVETLYKNLTWLRELNKKHKISFVSVLSPIGLTSSEVVKPISELSSERMEVSLLVDCNSYCGRKIRILDNATSTSSTCTAGGLILVGARPYILTVGHSFIRGNRSEPPPYLYDDEEPNEKDLEEESNSDADSLPCIFDEDDDDDWESHYQRPTLFPSVPSSNGYCTESINTESTPSSLPQVLNVCEDGHEDMYTSTQLVYTSSFWPVAMTSQEDWALLALPEGETLPNKTVLNHYINGTASVPTDTRRVSIVHPGLCIDDVLPSGILHPLITTLKIGMHIYKAYRITTTSIWPAGTSGAWVLLDGKVCGHVIAARQNEPWLYMVSIDAIFDDIKLRLGVQDVEILSQHSHIKSKYEQPPGSQSEPLVTTQSLHEVTGTTNAYFETNDVMSSTTSTAHTHQSWTSQDMVQEVSMQLHPNFVSSANSVHVQNSLHCGRFESLKVRVTDAEGNGFARQNLNPTIKIDPAGKSSPIEQSLCRPSQSLHPHKISDSDEKFHVPFTITTTNQEDSAMTSGFAKSKIGQDGVKAKAKIKSNAILLLARMVEWLVIRHEMRVRRIRQHEENASLKLRFKLFFFESIASTIKVSFNPKDEMCACKGVSMPEYAVLLPITLLYFLVFGFLHLWYYSKHRDLFESSESRLKRYTDTMIALRRDPSSYSRFKKPGPTFFRHHKRAVSRFKTPDRVYANTSLLMHQIFELADRRRLVLENSDLLYQSHTDEEALVVEHIPANVYNVNRHPSSTMQRQPVPQSKTNRIVEDRSISVATMNVRDFAVPLCGRNAPPVREACSSKSVSKVRLS